MGERWVCRKKEFSSKQMINNEVTGERDTRGTPTGQEEGVVLVSGRVLLGLEQGVEVPERALDEVVGRHLREAAGKAESSFSRHSS